MGFRLAPVIAGLWLAGSGFLPVGAVPLYPPVAAQKAAAVDLGPALAAGLDLPAPRASRLPHHLLVILADFPDQPHAGNLTPAVFDSLYFGPQGSVRDYYARSSFGRLQLDGEVVGWVRLPQAFTYYADSQNEGRGVLGAYPRNARRMVEDVVRAADPLVDLSRFDDDGPDGIPSSGDDDGVVDALVVVHAGPGSELGDRRAILSHTWSTVGVVPTADGVGAWKYSTVSEGSPLGVRAHEFGHLLGLPDLYQRQSVTRLAAGLGDWSLMASGAWLDDGHTPSDLDAASKVELGFVTPNAPQEGAVFPLRAPAGTNPGDCYMVWTHWRADLEYFVIENRQARGQDAFLPGSGMLVYHVDLTRAHNDDLEHPRVQLLQADGREDIERRINNGDPGDPYPGVGFRLGPDTQPGTRARDGRDSQITIDGISPPTSSMTFDLQVETLPLVSLLGVRMAEQSLGGDGVPEAGELLQFDIDVKNDGVAMGNGSAFIAAAPAGDVAWQTSTAGFAGLPKDATARLTFAGTPRADLGDPAGVTLKLVVVTAGYTDTLETFVGLGERSGFQACLAPEASRFTQDCSDPALPWTVTRLGASGDWQRETRPGEFGGVYRSATGTRYANNADVALVSPIFLLPPAATLRILHAYGTQDDAAGWAFDGGRVELSVDGRAWEALVPQGGYPRKLQPESVQYLAGAGVFGGHSDRRWDTFDLGTQGRSARLRFRFVSGPSGDDVGWEVARVEVTSAAAPSGPSRVDLVAEPNPMRFPGRVSFRVTASLTSAAQTTTLGVYDVGGRLVKSLPHAPVPAESGWFEWDGTDATGRRVASGVYFARLEWGGNSAAAKLLVLR